MAFPSRPKHLTPSPPDVLSERFSFRPSDSGLRRRDGAGPGPAGGRDAEPGGGEEPGDRGGVHPSRERDEGRPREPGR